MGVNRGRTGRKREMEQRETAKGFRVGGDLVDGDKCAKHCGIFILVSVLRGRALYSSSRARRQMDSTTKTKKKKKEVRVVLTLATLREFRCAPGGGFASSAARH
ncbi:hypothetical protein OUZ56_007645 [Daphnia magna]|uniref:Uncharacterized protein n=1 Tax=Daphnia magna TaxID=35525 RepID=A0ABR0AAX5_9CRUS|nr:hypothetical protein OUZ56_007645 [Daphnia magna]